MNIPQVGKWAIIRTGDNSATYAAHLSCGIFIRVEKHPAYCHISIVCNGTHVYHGDYPPGCTADTLKEIALKRATECYNEMKRKMDAASHELEALKLQVFAR